MLFHIELTFIKLDFKQKKYQGEKTIYKHKRPLEPRAMTFKVKLHIINIFIFIMSAFIKRFEKIRF